MRISPTDENSSKGSTPLTQPRIVTFGCRTNKFESELIRQYATAASLSESTIIVNTCAVTNEAERQARQAIRRLKRAQPDVRIVVTGCAAHLQPESFTAMPEVSLVLNNTEKLLAANWMRLGKKIQSAKEVPWKKESHSTKPLLAEFSERTRAFLPVQYGCNHRCTFCTIPFARGPSRSLPPTQVVDQALALSAVGYREFVLTGIDLTAYGLDLSADDKHTCFYGVSSLIKKLFREVPGLERLRLSSIDPSEIDEELFLLFCTERRLMPHMHLSIQAGDDMILKRMGRRHCRAEAIQVARRLRTVRPEVTLGADIIVGFPTETEEMFTHTLDLVEECGLTHLHIFPFSARPGTAAARIPAVSRAVVRERAARLRAVATKSLTRFLVGRVGTVASVLLEKPDFGYSEQYLPVRLTSSAKPGRIVSVRLLASNTTHLYGAILS